MRGCKVRDFVHISDVEERSGQGSISETAFRSFSYRLVVIKMCYFVYIKTLKCKIKQVGLCRHFKQL